MANVLLICLQFVASVGEARLNSQRHSTRRYLTIILLPTRGTQYRLRNVSYALPLTALDGQLAAVKL